MMKRFSTDIAWPIINLAKEKFKITLVKDNMADRGPLRTIPNNLYQKDMYKWNFTSSMDPKVKASLKTKEFPVSSPEYGVDTFYNFNKYMKDERGDWLKDCGWVKDDGSPVDLIYHFNKQGFRHDGSVSDIESEAGGVIYIGDSTVLGVGVNIEDTFTYKAHYQCEHTKNLRYINMGSHGYGIDQYYRILKYYIERVKPDVVVLTHPWIFSRSEGFCEKEQKWKVISINRLLRVFTENYNKLQRAGDDIYNLQTEFNEAMFHSSVCYLRFYRNLDAIKWLCHKNDVKFVCVEEEEDNAKTALVSKFINKVDHKDIARDLSHPGKKTHLHNSKVLAKVLDYCLQK